MTLALQNRNVGFDHGHYGWVSSHVLSQISHATPQNGFLGYSFALITESGQVDYSYFDRYPIFFSGFMNLALSSFDGEISRQVTLARTLMNVIFIFTIIMSYLLMNLIFKNPYLSLMSVLLTFSSSTILFYKDMVHFDQPSLLAIITMLYFIARYEMTGNRRGLIAVSIAAALIGRGYASFFILATWFATRFFRFKKIRNEISVYALASAVGIASLFLAHNIYREMTIRHVPFIKTSIVNSAASRLGVNSMQPELERKARLFKVATLQIEGLFFNIFPAVFGGPDQLMKKLRKMGHSPLGLAGLCVILLLLIWATKLVVQEWKTLSPQILPVTWLMLLSGPFWGLFMRKLTAFHQYTSIYLIPASLIFVFLFLKAIAPRLNTHKKEWAALATALILFISGLYSVKNILEENLEIAVQQTSDFQNIVNVLPKEGAKIFAESGPRNYVIGAPFALAYYFSKHYLSPEQFATHVLTKTQPAADKNLTPHNRFFFLKLK